MSRIGGPSRLKLEPLNRGGSAMTTTDIAVTETYVENRERMLGVAYRILGRVADAEDVVQEAWLRWTRVSPDEVENPRAFLTQVTARLALDRLRRIKARHEAYTG